MYLPWWFHSKFFRSTSSYVRTATKKCLTRIWGIDCIPKMASTNCGFAVTRAPTRSCCFSKHLLRWNQIKIQYFSPRLRNHNFCYLIYLNPIYLRLPMCAKLFFFWISCWRHFFLHPNSFCIFVILQMKAVLKRQKYPMKRRKNPTKRRTKIKRPKCGNWNGEKNGNGENLDNRR